MQTNEYIETLDEHVNIEWELGDIVDYDDHIDFHEATGEDTEGRYYEATISMVDNRHGNGLLGEVEDVEQVLFNPKHDAF